MAATIVSRSARGTNTPSGAATRSFPRGPICGRLRSPISPASTTPRSARRFAKTAIKRTGRDRFVRNVLIAIGNSGERGLALHAERLLADPAALVRGAAVWALSRLLPADDFRALAARHRAGETDADVADEWTTALAERA